MTSAKLLNIVLTTLLWISSTFSFAQDFDLQGHRGARGLMPENSIPGFLKALDLGVTTIEMDVVISKDSLVVVSHDPYFLPAICLDPDGIEIPKKTEKEHNLFLMNYAEIKMYDCGSKPVSEFPLQEKMTVYKPLLSEVIKAVEKHLKGYTGYLVNYNVEIKSSPDGDSVFQPVPKVFSGLVYDQINRYLDLERVIIQSFDFRVLRYWHEQYPEIKLAALVANMNSWSKNIEALGFQPEIYSPYYKMLDKNEVNALHEAGMKVIPWTVNEEADMTKMIEMGVDGLITDYPDRAGALGLAIKIPYGKDR